MKTISIFFFLTKMFSKFYKKYYKRRYKKRYKRRYTPLYKRVINNSSRSRVSVSISNESEWGLAINPSDVWTPPVGIHPFVEVNTIPAGTDNNINYKAICSLVNTDLYRAFAQLYEQVKIDSMTVTITALTPMSLYNGSLEFHTAWDRKCSMNEIHHTSAQAAPGAAFYPNSQQLASLASHSSAIATTNSIPVIRRTVWASDILEKTQFIDTDYGSTNTTVYDINNVNVIYNADWMGSNNQLTACQFCPMLFFGVNSHVTFQTLVTVPFKFEVTYKVTFRNPKFGGSNGGSNKLRQKVPVGTTTGLAQAIKQELTNPIAEDTGDGTGILQAAKRQLAEALGGADPTGEITKLLKTNPDEDVTTALRRIWSEVSQRVPNLSSSIPSIPLDFQNGAISSAAAAAAEQLLK